jgi:hypothetical protein
MKKKRIEGWLQIIDIFFLVVSMTTREKGAFGCGGTFNLGSDVSRIFGDAYSKIWYHFACQM